MIIDFSHPSALDGVLSCAYQHKLPTVIATTGLFDEQVEEINKLSKLLPIFYSGTCQSALVFNRACPCRAVLGGEFDIEILKAPQPENRRARPAPR